MTSLGSPSSCEVMDADALTPILYVKKEIQRGLLEVRTRTPGTYFSILVFKPGTNCDPEGSLLILGQGGGVVAQGGGLISNKAWEASCCQGLSCITKKTQISRRHINKTALIMISANYEM